MFSEQSHFDETTGNLIGIEVATNLRDKRMGLGATRKRKKKKCRCENYLKGEGSVV